MAAIKLHAQTLQQPDLTAEERAVFNDHIVREADRIGDLVDNLLTGSRLAAGQGESLAPVPLDAFFADYAPAALRRFDLSEVELRFDISTEAAVMATHGGLQRVLDNLIDNALRFTKPGGTVRCLAHDTPGTVHIVVADTGIGIPRRELTRIFDRFYRLGRDLAGQRKGTGLGLAIVRGLVDEMRGTIRAVSGHGEPGSRFEIRLPMVAAPSGARGPA